MAGSNLTRTFPGLEIEQHASEPDRPGFPVLSDEVFCLFLGSRSGDPFTGLRFGRRDLNAPASGMLYGGKTLASGTPVLTSVYLKNLSRMADLVTFVQN